MRLRHDLRRRLLRRLAHRLRIRRGAQGLDRLQQLIPIIDRIVARIVPTIVGRVLIASRMELGLQGLRSGSDRGQVWCHSRIHDLLVCHDHTHVVRVGVELLRCLHDRFEADLVP